MKKTAMDRSGTIIIKICIFSIILSLTALVLCGLFRYWTEKDTETLITSDLPLIIIDAGHGGEDGGAIASDGTAEKDLNLSVALILGNMLKSSGFEVVQTRSEDTMLYTDHSSGSLKMQDLRNRLNIANANENAIFISIHMNKFSQAKYSGLQVFYSRNTKESEVLANTIQANVKALLQTENNRQTKAAGTNIYLLDNIKIPAVLVECGFLSNPDECALLNTDEYRKELATVIYSSVIEFFEQV